MKKPFKTIVGIFIAFYYGACSVKEYKRERMAKWTREYDDIRGNIFMAISTAAIPALEKQVANFKREAKKDLPLETFEVFCNHLDTLLSNKEMELVATENELFMLYGPLCYQ